MQQAFRPVLPGLIQFDLLDLLWTVLSSIFMLGRPQFELKVNKRDLLFCLAQNSRKLRHGSLVIYSKKQGGGLSSEDLALRL